MLLICSTRVRVRREHLECIRQRARGIERAVRPRGNYPTARERWIPEDGV